MICKDIGVCGGNQDAGVNVPLTSTRSLMWNNDFGIYGMISLSDDTPHMDNDCYNETNENSDDSNGDNSGCNTRDHRVNVLKEKWKFGINWYSKSQKKSTESVEGSTLSLKYLRK